MKMAAIGGIAAGVVIVVIVGIFLGTGTDQKPQQQLPQNIQEETPPVRSTPDNILPSKTTQPSEKYCNPSYPDICISTWPPDLDCDDIPYRDFMVLYPDQHKFDEDKDGIGCER